MKSVKIAGNINTKGVFSTSITIFPLRRDVQAKSGLSVLITLGKIVFSFPSNNSLIYPLSIIASISIFFNFSKIILTFSSSTISLI